MSRSSDGTRTTSQSASNATAPTAWFEHGKATRRRAARNDVFVDSSAWIALFSLRDRLHREADQAFRAAIRARVRMFTTDLVIAEVHRLLLFRAGIAPAARAIEIIDASARRARASKSV